MSGILLFIVAWYAFGLGCQLASLRALAFGNWSRVTTRMWVSIPLVASLGPLDLLTVVYVDGSGVPQGVRFVWQRPND